MGMIADWAETFGNANTRRVNLAGLYTFLDRIYGKQRSSSHIKNSEREKYENLVEDYFSSERDHVQELMVFAASLHEAPPNTANNYMNAVREFLSVRGVEIPDRQWKKIRLKLPKGGTRTIEKDLDHEALRKILTHLDLKGRAFVLVLASTGMRRGEALQIQVDDLDLDATPAEITIRAEYTKPGRQRFSFLTTEALQALTEWLNVRERYLASACNRNAGLVRTGRAKKKSSEDQRIFPFTDQVVTEFWTRAVEKAGLLSYDRSTGRAQIHVHQTRKFFISQLSLAVSKEVPETLAGHSGYLTGSYRRYTKAQLAEEFLKGEPRLTVLTPNDYQELQSDFRSRLADQSAIVENIVAKNIQLESEISMLRDAVAAVTISSDYLNDLLEHPEINANKLRRLKALLHQI